MDTPDTGTPTPDDEQKPAPRKQRSVLIWGLAAGVVIVVGAGVVWAFASASDAEPRTQPTQAATATTQPPTATRTDLSGQRACDRIMTDDRLALPRGDDWDDPERVQEWTQAWYDVASQASSADERGVHAAATVIRDLVEDNNGDLGKVAVGLTEGNDPVWLILLTECWDAKLITDDGLAQRTMELAGVN